MELICKISTSGRLILLALILISLAGCGVYSFTGASIPPEAKSISIPSFPNNAQLVHPSLSRILTDALRDKFMSQTSLTIVPRNGDLVIEGAITDYSTQPVAITGEQTAALNRLTISVRVKFTNRFDEKQNFESSFSRYEDYVSTLALSAVEENLISQITEALVQDIFNRSVVNW